MSGADIARDIARTHPEVEVIFCSGYTASAIVHQGRLDPTARLLEKPFSEEDLATILDQALERRRSMKD